MKPYLIIGFALCSSLLSSCGLKDVEYVLPFEGEKLVVGGFFEPNHTFKVKVHHTLPPLSSSTDIKINDATVILYADGLAIDTLVLAADGEYMSDQLPLPHIGYSISVESPRFARVVSEIDSLPEPITLSNTHFDLVGETNDTAYYNFFSSFETTINDYNPDDLYYAQYGYLRMTDGRYASGPSFSRLETNPFYFPDVYLDGKIVGYPYITTYSGITSNGDTIIIQPSQLLIRTCCISKKFNDYLVSTERHNDGQDNGFTVPSELMTTIQGGYGVFAGYQYQEFVYNF